MVQDADERILIIHIGLQMERQAKIPISNADKSRSSRLYLTFEG
jgi:hypothetical protein